MKLASYDFDIKYVPGSQNAVADALSRVPFANVGHRLLNEPFDRLMHDVKELSDVCIQNAFRKSVKCDDDLTHAVSMVQNPISVSSGVVSAVLQSLYEWGNWCKSLCFRDLQIASDG